MVNDLKLFLSAILIFLFGLSSQGSVKETRIPLQKKLWQELKYSSLPANQVKEVEDSLEITADKSGSPLIFPLTRPQRVERLQFKASVEGDLNLKEGRQGESGYDDFLLRVGLVFAGKKKLGFWQRQVAAKWALKLFSLAPKGQGVDHILFFNVYSDPRLKGQSRVHPDSRGLINERFVVEKPQDGEIQVNTPVDVDRDVLAVWVGVDADDTKSKFKVRLKEILLKGE